mmetsp:Transcript_16589/g.15934  ORF Transcript_16589/g.15934 Transcript_16589/m.15934 type:complete len:149 (+) Transcript_16589:135-581(+)|eukprot:CAMPEP_0119034040 /NCGR_PEP_ID=MMETSP1177-20130426/1099_1 /TAXON_ID=2985 /ORGANISM="Ochromonas sp, Strain CCMP1899" /LENGTH=148 /DNA_ID=CAMNT_0006991239 /DNA_START=113 /DNA_END=559 /DNA_ORIENTATION=+
MTAAVEVAPEVKVAPVDGVTYIKEIDVGKHDTEEDCWLVIGNDNNGGAMVYDVTKYLSDHPGGPEIMLEFAGKDADDMYEDIGHSNEARKTMKKYLIGHLEVDPNKPKKVAGKKSGSDIKSGGGLNPIAIIILLIAIACGVYFSQMSK